MKKIFTFLAAIMMASFMFAGGGIFEAWMTINTNGGEPKPYKVNDGISLGVTKSGTLDSVFVKVWKDNSTDIQEVYMGYRIDGGEDKELKLNFGKNLEGNNQEWNNEVKHDLMKDMSGGDHTIALWFKAKTNKAECDEFIYMNNQGKDYLLTFSIGSMFAKNNWEGPSTSPWTWKTMTEVSKDTFVLEKVVFGGQGLNVSAERKDEGSKWFGLKDMSYIGDTIQAKDTVNFVYAINGTDTTLTATLVGRPKMVEIKMVQDTMWSADGAKVTAWAWEAGKKGEWSEFATNRNDTLVLKVNERADSIIFVRMSDKATQPDWEPKWNEIKKSEIAECRTFIITNWAEGVWCERPCTGEFGILVNGNYTAAAINPDHQGGTEYMVKNIILHKGDSVQMYDKCEGVAWVIGDYMDGSMEFTVVNGKYVVEEDGRYDFYFQLGPDKLYVGKFILYAKGKWENDTWSWKKMEQTAIDSFELKKVVYRGGGVNINIKEEDDKSIQFDIKDMKFTADTIEMNDTVNFMFSLVDSTLTATLVGRPEKPCGDFGILVNGTYKAATINPDRTDVTEYVIMNVVFAINDSVQMYNNCKKEAWLIQNYMDSSYVFTIDKNKYVINEAGTYDFYFQLGPDKLFVNKHVEPTPDYGIMHNGVYKMGEVSGIDGGKMYVVNTMAQVGDSVQIYDNLEKKSLLVTLDNAGYTDFQVVSATNTYVVKNEGQYQFKISVLTASTTPSLFVGYQGKSALQTILNETVQSKILIDGQLFIIRNGVRYNANGMRVQ